jgi:hypothetical protein
LVVVGQFSKFPFCPFLFDFRSAPEINIHYRK